MGSISGGVGVGVEPDPKKLTKLSNIIKKLKKHPEFTILHVTEKENKDFNKIEVKIASENFWSCENYQSTLHYHFVPTNKPVNEEELGVIVKKLFDLDWKSYDSSRPYTLHDSSCYDLRTVIDIREKIGEGRKKTTKDYCFTSKKVIKKIFRENAKEFNNNKLKNVNEYSCNYYIRLRLNFYRNAEYAKKAFEQDNLTLSEEEQSRLDDLLKRHQQYEKQSKKGILQKMSLIS